MNKKNLSESDLCDKVTIESNEVFKVQPFTHMGSASELINSFGGRTQYLGALQTLERELYAPGTSKTTPFGN